MELGCDTRYLVVDVEYSVQASGEVSLRRMENDLQIA